jgi:hypothetical protein
MVSTNHLPAASIEQRTLRRFQDADDFQGKSAAGPRLKAFLAALNKVLAFHLKGLYPYQRVWDGLPGSI